MSAGTIGFCSVTSRSTSVSDTKNFMLAATVKRSRHPSDFVLGGVSAESQNVGNPETGGNSALNDNSRSVMLKTLMNTN